MTTDIAERFPQTFADVVAAETGAVFCDEFEDGIRFLILRGPSALCAYLGLPTAHPLAGWEYDHLTIDCHYGLTYSGSGIHGDGSTYWYGWDYSHSGDRSTYDFGRSDRAFMRDEKEWTPALVYADAWTARYEFKALVKLSERIARKGWQSARSARPKVAN